MSVSNEHGDDREDEHAVEAGTKGFAEKVGFTTIPMATRDSEPPGRFAPVER